MGVRCLHTYFVDIKDRDEINPILLKFLGTLDGPVLPNVVIRYDFLNISNINIK